MRDNFSGAQRNLYRLLINLNRDKVEPILIGQVESPLTNLIIKHEIDTKIIPYPIELEVYDKKLLNFNLLRILKFIKGIYIYNRNLVKDCKSINPEIIWCDNIRTLITIYITCRILKVKVIWNIWSEPEGKVAWILHRVGLVLADVVNLAYKSQGKKVFGSLGEFSHFKRKIVPIYNGVNDFEEMTDNNIRRELCLSEEDILLVMASNIVPGKGQMDLINSMDSILKETSKVHLVLAGSTVNSSATSIQYKEELNKEVSKRNLNHNVHFIGWRSDIRDVLFKSDIYVSSSYSESLPDAVRDAMLASLPLVVSNVGGTFELVEEGKNGYLFEAGDIDTLTEYLKKLISDLSLRELMGSHSKTIIDKKFSTKSYAKNFEIMLHNTINR